MIEKYFGGVLPAPGEGAEPDGELIALAEATLPAVEKKMDEFQFSLALTEIWKLISRCNKYIDETMPWALAKDEGKKGRLATVLYNLAEAARIISVLIAPVMTKTPAKIQAALGVPGELATLESIRHFGGIRPGSVVKKMELLFPRIDIEAELAAQEAEKEMKKEEKKTEEPAPQPMITIEDFAKVSLKTARVLTCEKLEGSDKLLKMQLDAGGEKRTVVSGIAKWYTPEEMVGKTVVLVANLKPAKLRGVVSEGMILCSEDENGRLSLVAPEQTMPAGAVVR